MSKTLKDKQEIVKDLQKIILPEQRTKEWHEMRNRMITASDFGAILGHNKYESYKKTLRKKCGLEKKFFGNEYTEWGVKYEPIATSLYEIKNETTIIEFGCIPHPTYSFLGASPDGITPDGMMLEIKVPKCREIKGGDIPEYYYDQVQGQLEVCDLDEADFLECKIEEYTSEKHYIKDDEIDFKGVIIDYLLDDKKTYEYSPINIKGDEYKKWLCGKKIVYNNIYINVSYWKLITYSSQRVNREKEWLPRSLPIFDKFWKEVLYYRENPELITLKKKKKVIKDDRECSN
jgi:putative phage-type endonuclease